MLLSFLPSQRWPRSDVKQSLPAGTTSDYNTVPFEPTPVCTGTVETPLTITADGCSLLDPVSPQAPILQSTVWSLPLVLTILAYHLSHSGRVRADGFREYLLQQQNINFSSENILRILTNEKT